MRTTGKPAMKTKGRPHSRLGQVRDNSKPTKERLLFGIEAADARPSARSLAFKIIGT